MRPYISTGRNLYSIVEGFVRSVLFLTWVGLVVVNSAKKELRVLDSPWQTGAGCATPGCTATAAAAVVAVQLFVVELGTSS